MIVHHGRARPEDTDQGKTVMRTEMIGVCKRRRTNDIECARLSTFSEELLVEGWLNGRWLRGQVEKGGWRRTVVKLDEGRQIVLADITRAGPWDQ